MYGIHGCKLHSRKSVPGDLSGSLTAGHNGMFLTCGLSPALLML